jgi:hypothetical protein
MFSFAVPLYHHNYLQHQECDEPIMHNVTNEWYWCIPQCVCHLCCFSLCGICTRCCLLLTQTSYCNTTSGFASRIPLFVVVMLVLKVAITGYVSSEVLIYVTQKT